MNTRSIYKRLVRNNVRTDWGKRAFLTVRLPLSVLPSDPPAYKCPYTKEEGWEEDYLGMWRRSRAREDGLRVEEAVWVMRHGSTNSVDEIREEFPHAIVVGGQDNGWAHYYLADKSVTTIDTDGNRTFERYPLKEPWVQDLVDYLEWKFRVFMPKEGVECSRHAVLEDLLDGEVAAYFKTYYVRLSDTHIYIQYSVKSTYHSRMRRFSAALSRAMDLAKKAHVDVKVMS